MSGKVIPQKSYADAVKGIYVGEESNPGDSVIKGLGKYITMERVQPDINTARSMIPLFNASDPMPLQIQTGLTHLENMLDKIEHSQIGTTLDFGVYCENEIAPCCTKLQGCFQTVTTCAENMNKKYAEKMEMLIYQKSQAGEKLRTVILEQKLNETKISNCKDQINEAKKAKQISVNDIEDADKNIRRLEAEIEEAETQQIVAGSVAGAATVLSLLFPPAIPVVLASGAGVVGGIIGLEKKKEEFADQKRQEKANLDKLEASVKLKNMELKSIQKERENLQQKICEQKQSIHDLNNEISTLKLQMNITVDVLQIARNVCRSVNSVSVAVNVLKLETTNAYALEPLMIPLMELNTNLHQLFRSLPQPCRDKIESTMTQIESKQKMIKAITFSESTEFFF